jgi:hypothetical protein
MGVDCDGWVRLAVLGIRVGPDLDVGSVGGPEFLPTEGKPILPSPPATRKEDGDEEYKSFFPINLCHDILRGSKRGGRAI